MANDQYQYVAESPDGRQVGWDGKQWVPIASPAADPKTGKGMEAYAQRQAGQAGRSLLDKLQERETAYSMFTPTGVSGPLGDQEVARTRKAADVTATGAGVLAGGAGLAGLPLKQAIATGAGGIAGGLGGGIVGGAGGRQMGKVPGLLLGDPEMEKRGSQIGEALGTIGGGMAGGYAGGRLGYRGGGIPLKMRIAGVPIEGEMGGTGRAGSAGDLASWNEQDLWSGYMKNQGTPQGESLAREIQRRGLASSPAGTYRPPAPTESQPLKSKVAQAVETGGTGGAGGPSPISQSPSSHPSPAPTERRGSVRSLTGPDPMRTALMNDLRQQVQQGIPGAQDRLNDMLANPFESGAGLGEEIRQARARQGSIPLPGRGGKP